MKTKFKGTTHTYPKQDTFHTLSMNCRCKPEQARPDLIVHNRVKKTIGDFFREIARRDYGL